MSVFDTHYHEHAQGKKVAYFSMEYAIHQSLKIYSGGLGFLAGSHLRSAYALKKNLIGVGILWSYGYYDQVRDEENNMRTAFIRKEYHFLKATDIKFHITVNGATVWVTAYYLAPEIFNTAPLYLLSTDLPENDYLARSIVQKLYAPDHAAKIAQSILLGIGGAKLLHHISFEPDIYHLNEGHGLPLVFHLYHVYRSIEDVKKRLVFTTHTPEKAGNEEHSIELLNKMSFFNSISLEEVRKITGATGDEMNYTLTALRLAKIANGVSQVHGRVAQQMWGNNPGVAPIIAITNAQNKKYWMDKKLKEFIERGEDDQLVKRKKELKKRLFEVVADQTGRLFDVDVLTIVWARRFAGYKRADLLLKDFERFVGLVQHTSNPVQIIWAGKPYPEDQGAIQIFNDIIAKTKHLKQCAVLTGYELRLSAILKKGADVWLNTPRYPREASGTSGMTAAMNGAVNFSVADGWFPEFVRHGENGFAIPVKDSPDYFSRQDDEDHKNLFMILENEIIPTYYNQKQKWLKIMKSSMSEVSPKFDSDRMVEEYYQKLYDAWD
jgi:glycogen phosphorylase